MIGTKSLVPVSAHMFLVTKPGAGQLDELQPIE